MGGLVDTSLTGILATQKKFKEVTKQAAAKVDNSIW
jgi:hypothetical protein